MTKAELRKPEEILKAVVSLRMTAGQILKSGLKHKPDKADGHPEDRVRVEKISFRPHA